MIILAVGMPRAGSGWHYNLVHDLVVASGGQDARIIRKRFFLSPILTKVNCNIRVLSTKRLAPVLVPSMLGNTFAIKTHSGPTPAALRLLQTRRMRATYIYRDPRAVLLSAHEYGERSRAAGRVNAFARLDSMDKAIDFVMSYLRIWQAWVSVKGIHAVKYENMLSDYDVEAARLAAFLGADVSKPSVIEAIDFYRSEKRSSAGKGQHFRFGEAERFRNVLRPPDIEAANRAFAPYLREMGYKL